MKRSRHSSDDLIPCQAFRTTFEGIAEALLACQFEDNWTYLVGSSSWCQSLLLLAFGLFCGMDSEFVDVGHLPWHHLELPPLCFACVFIVECDVMWWHHSIINIAGRCCRKQNISSIDTSHSDMTLMSLLLRFLTSYLVASNNSEQDLFKVSRDDLQ